MEPIKKEIKLIGLYLVEVVLQAESKTLTKLRGLIVLFGIPIVLILVGHFQWNAEWTYWVIAVGWVVCVGCFINPYSFWRQYKTCTICPVKFSRIFKEDYTPYGPHWIAEVYNTTYDNVRAYPDIVKATSLTNPNFQTPIGPLLWSTRYGNEREYHDIPPLGEAPRLFDIVYLLPFDATIIDVPKRHDICIFFRGTKQYRENMHIPPGVYRFLIALCPEKFQPLYLVCELETDGSEAYFNMRSLFADPSRTKAIQVFDEGDYESQRAVSRYVNREKDFNMLELHTLIAQPTLTSERLPEESKDL